jgi:microcystin-dependent protein
MRPTVYRKRGRALGAAVLCGCAVLGATDAGAQQTPTPSPPYVGEVKFVAFDFCPSGWAEANGQELSATDPANQALLSVINTTYGGDGQTTFAVPNLTGAVSTQDGTAAATSTPDVEHEPIVVQPVRRQQVVVQKVTKQRFVVKQKVVVNVAQPQTPGEQPPPASPGSGQPLLACIALQGVTPTDPTTGSPDTTPTPSSTTTN